MDIRELMKLNETDAPEEFVKFKFQLCDIFKEFIGARFVTLLSYYVTEDNYLSALLSYTKTFYDEEQEPVYNTYNECVCCEAIYLEKCNDWSRFEIVDTDDGYLFVPKDVGLCVLEEV